MRPSIGSDGRRVWTLSSLSASKVSWRILGAMLTVAAVQGEEFTAEVVASALGYNQKDTVERLKRRSGSRTGTHNPRSYRAASFGEFTEETLPLSFPACPLSEVPVRSPG